MKWRLWAGVRGFAAAGLLMVGASARAAAPLEDKVPSDAIIYAGWAGAAALQAGYAGSNLKGIVDASTARAFIQEGLPKLIALAGREDPSAPGQIEKLEKGLGIAWRHPVAFYVEPPDFVNPQQPQPHLALICDAGDDAASLSSLLNEALKNIPPSPVPITCTTEAGLVRLVVGTPVKVSGTISADPGYMKAMKQVTQGTPAITMYIDVQKAVAAVNDALEKAPGTPPDVKPRVDQLLDSSGVSNMTQLAAASGFDGKGWTDQLFVGYRGEPRGFMALAAAKPLSDGLLAVVPRDAASFTAFHFDAGNLFDDVRTLAGKIDPQAETKINEALAMVNAQLGVDIEKDFLAPLGNEWVLYRAPLSDEGGLNFAMVHKLSDGEHFAQTIARLEALSEKLSRGRFKVDKVTTEKIQVSSISYLTFSLAWTVRNGYLYVASLDGIAGAVKQVEEKKPGIAQSDLYKKAMAEMPRGVRPLSITYSNPLKAYPEVQHLLRGLPLLARAAGVDVPSGLFPETSDVAPYLTPGAAISWWDTDGLHMSGHWAFPGAQVLSAGPGGPGMAATAALGVAVLLPSLGRAKEMANRSVDAADLRGIVQSSMVYAAGNNDKMPDDVARLVAEGDISTKQLVSKRAGTEPLEMTAEMQTLATHDFAKFSAEVAKHCDYIYLGKGTTSDADADVIVAFEKPSPSAIDGINIAYQDGHVDFLRWAAVPEAFKHTNEYLKGKNLPTVNIEELMQEGQVPVGPGGSTLAPLPAPPVGVP